MRKRKEIKIEDLAAMVNKGFNGMSDIMNKQFGEVGKQFGEIDEQFGEVNRQFGEVNKKLDVLETGQEDIKLRLSNCLSL